MRNVFLCFIFIASGLLITGNAHAQNDGGSGLLGFMGGFSVPDLTKAGPHTLFGLRGHAQISGPIGLGGYYLVASKEQGTTVTKFDYSLHGFEVAYHLPSASGEFYFAFRAGVSKIKTKDTTNVLDLMYSPYHYGIAVGQQYYFWGNSIALGYEGCILHFQPARTTDTSSNIYYQEAFNMLNFMASISLLF